MSQPTTNTAMKNQPKKRGYFRGCLITVLVLALPVWWFCFHTTPLRVSEETTYVLGPMTSDGKRIDYFRAMEERFYPPEMKTDDNGYRLIVRACGDMVDRTVGSCCGDKCEDRRELGCAPLLRLQVYEKLGLDPNEKPTVPLKIDSPYARDCYLDKYDKENPPAEGEWTQYARHQRTSHPFWTLDDFPMLQDWLDENMAGIDLLSEAVRKPVFRIPYVRENENVPIGECLQGNEVHMMLGWARAALARAQYRLGIGDIDGAIDDSVTILRLGRHVGKQGTVFALLIGRAIEGRGYSVGIGSNPKFPPTKEQIERHLAELGALPPRQTLSEALESERLFVLAGCQDLYWGNVGDSSLGLYEEMSTLEKMFPYMSWSLDINTFLARVNKIYDVLAGESETVDGRELEDILKPAWNPLPLLFVHSRTNWLTDQMSSLFVPALQAAASGWQLSECMENVQRLTLALLLYEKDHGKLPDGDWREAIRPYLGDNADKYFRCPSHPDLPEGYTSYAMIQYGKRAGDYVPANGDTVAGSPNTLLLVEVHPPMKLREGDGTISEATAKLGINRRDEAEQFTEGLGSHHVGGMNTGLRSGALRFYANTTETEELQQLIDGSAAALP